MIVDIRWYGSKTITSYHVGIEDEVDTTVVSWVVLTFNWYRFKAYIWVSDKNDETLDAQEIADWGNKVDKGIALAIFWNVEKMDWLTVYSLEDNYKN